MMEKIADAWEEVGFAVTEREVITEGSKVAGHGLQSSPPRLRLAIAKEASYLEAALAWILETPRVDVGAWLRGALLRRELMSAPAAAFDLMGKKQ
eukprot:7878174-Pyramimonas_sp.AAC.1